MRPSAERRPHCWTRWTSHLAAFVALVSCLVGTSPSAVAQRGRIEERDLSLLVGEQTSVPARGVESYSMGLEGIVDVRVTTDGSSFVVVALQPGDTTMLLILEDGRQIQYRINVSTGQEDPSAVEERDNIRLDFYFVQVAESYAHQIGIGYPSVIGPATFSATLDLLQPAIVGATAVIAEQPLPRVDLLQTSGWARIMSQVALVTVNGNEAAFESGGEVNVPIQAGLGTGLAQVEFGSIVRIRPRFDEETNRIELRINADVSDLTEDRGTGVPGRSTSNLQTMVNLEMGQSVVLAGIITEKARNQQTGLPGLSQIPIIGILFGSNARQKEATQNLLFIVPTVVDVVSMQARRLIEDAFEVYWDYSGDIEDIQMLPTPRGIPSAADPDAEPISSRSKPKRSDDDDGG